VRLRPAVPVMPSFGFAGITALLGDLARVQTARGPHGRTHEPRQIVMWSQATT
jgi:hypothetical protein